MADVKNSDLIKTVFTLAEHFAELERVGGKINSMDIKTDSDFEHIQKLLSRFAECGESVSQEVTRLSALLTDARNKAENIAAGVASRAEEVRKRRVEESQKFEEFSLLGEKVRQLSSTLASLRRNEGESLTNEDRAKLSMSLSEVEVQLHPLIEQAQRLRREAHDRRMKNLEQNADSLTQTLQSIQRKLGELNLPQVMQ